MTEYQKALLRSKISVCLHQAIELLSLGEMESFDNLMLTVAQLRNNLEIDEHAA